MQAEIEIVYLNRCCHNEVLQALLCQWQRGFLSLERNQEDTEFILLCGKWIITKGATTSLFDRNVHHLVATSTLPNGHVTSLIVEKVAIPVPPKFDDVIDIMDCWAFVSVVYGNTRAFMS